MVSRRLKPERAAIGTIPNRNIPLIQILPPPIHSRIGRFARSGAGRVLPLLIGWAVAGAWPAFAAQVSLIPKSDKGLAVEQVPMEANGRAIRVWKSEDEAGGLAFKSAGPVVIPASGTLYLSVSYVDRGYGRLSVQLAAKGGKTVKPDRFLGLTLMDTGNVVTARMRMAGIQGAGSGEVAVRIGLDQPAGHPLLIESVTLQDTPFADPDFAYVISDPWHGPYAGPGIKPADNSTLKGKVMAGYQGWFRTPNDPDGRGWSHWGNIQEGTFTIDMWPDISEYPVTTLEKAAAVKLQSGKPGYLFSSAWPGVVDTHFRWMREHDIDGVFLQRFVSDNFHSINDSPEWVLANVRAAARREGRLWALEYDVSGYPDARLLETLQTDWKWLVGEFGILKDPNYAREGGKPVVFIWGLPFPNRKVSPATANAVVDFFANDPAYGGNYVIGGIPGNWRQLAAPWQEHITRYGCVLAWMSESYAEDLADFRKLGLASYAHVTPGFSWANLKHLPSGDPSVDYTPRDGGRHYWKLLSKAAQAGSDRLFVGMFDEYDEATAIMPMSDDTPATPVRPGVAATFYNGSGAQEHGEFVLLPSAEIALGTTAPGRRTAVDNFFVRMGGRIVFPIAGPYTFAIEGAPGDDAELTIDGRRVLAVKDMTGVATAGTPVMATAGQAMSYRLDYRHGTGSGTLRLLWESPSHARQPVPAGMLHDAWGRFVTNDGKPSDWWLKLTGMAKEMMRGKRNPGSPMP